MLRRRDTQTDRQTLPGKTFAGAKGSVFLMNTEHLEISKRWEQVISQLPVLGAESRGADHLCCPVMADSSVGDLCVNLLSLLLV